MGIGLGEVGREQMCIRDSYNLAGKGTLKVIGGMSREKAGYPLIGYFASNNAYAAGLKTPRDLAGKRVAVTQVGSSFHYSLSLIHI